MTLESVKMVIKACIEYIGQNAAWLGIAGIAVLILLLLFGFVSSAGRSRKQIKYLRKIDSKMSQVLENQQTELACRAAAEKQASREDAVDLFFSETEVEEQTAVLPAEQGSAAEAPAGGSLVKDEPVQQEPEEEQPEEPAAISMDSLRESLLCARDRELKPAAEEELKAVPDGPAARGKSGRLYTREELENQIRK